MSRSSNKTGFRLAIGAAILIGAAGLPSKAVESTGVPECATIRDKTGDGKADVSFFDKHGMPAHCWPDHPDYVQPEGGWPPDPNFER